jgi:GNAT superfamily N-acetyltransferase
MDWYEEQRQLIDRCSRQLVTEGWIEPLAAGAGEARRWNLWELASLVEGHFHQQLDVTSLSDEQRVAYERRASFDGRPLPSPHSEYRCPYWLVHRGRRAGTIAIAAVPTGAGFISLSSLYVDPAERRRGIAGRALQAVFDVGLANGACGIRLGTSWTWQPAVRFYARIGMWVWMWKHELVFVRDRELPAYRVERRGSRARFLVEQAGQWRAMIEAERRGDRLGWQPDPAYEEHTELAHCASGTFALHLALAGWPLIRSDDMWGKRYHWSDAGEPEGLAYKIELFEAVDRRRGFDVQTPRIPGIAYRDLEDIE